MYVRIRLLFLYFVILLANNSLLANPNIQVKSFIKENDGVLFKMEPGLLKLQVCSDKIIRVIYTPKEELPKEMDSHAVVTLDWAKVDFNVTDKNDEIVVSTDKVNVVVDKKSGAVNFYDKSGRLYCRKFLQAEKYLFRRE